MENWYKVVINPLYNKILFNGHDNLRTFENL